MRRVQGPGGSNETDNEEEEEDVIDEAEEQRIGAAGPIEESEDPDAWIERNHDQMEVEEAEEECYELEADDELMAPMRTTRKNMSTPEA